MFYLKEYVSYYRKTDVSMSKTTARSTTAAAVLAYDFLKSLKLDKKLEPARELALKRIVPIVVSVYARNHQPALALGIALSHLYAYDYGLNKRLYFHLMLVLKGLTATGTLKSSHAERLGNAQNVPSSGSGPRVEACGFDIFTTRAVRADS